MHTEKTVTRADKFRECALLSIAHGQFAGGEEHHSAVTLQILGCEDGAVTSKPAVAPICFKISREAGMTSCR
jgi:hypothetical protein